MPRPLPSRIAFVILGVGVFAAASLARLLQLQIVQSDLLRERARRQHEQRVVVDGRRGAIVDRHGRELAVSVTTQSLFAHPPRIENVERAARLLAPVLRMSQGDVGAKLRSDARFVWVARRLDPETAEAVRALDLPVGPGEAFGFEDEPSRFYPQGSLAIQIVGHADIDQKGIEGIERRFDEELRCDGTNFLAVMDAKGGMRLQLVRPPAKLSSDVVLTLDLVVQHILERELDRAMRETRSKAATGIVLDPTTGEILAISNRPTVTGGRGDAESRRNRAVTDLYEPGSTFKVFTAAAALDRARVSPGTVFDCRALTIAGKPYHDVHVHGALTVREILEASSNIGIIKVGRTLSREDLRDYVLRFGFGRRTGIELPGERAGRVTSLAGMSALSPASMSMGYEIAVTPLQIASAVGAIANGGVLVPPRIVLGTRDASGAFARSPSPEPRRAISPRTAAALQDMLEGVVLRGTGTRASVPGYRVAGKTGTARKVGPGGRYTTDYFSSFVGFGPLASPRLVALVVLDTPTSGDYYGGLIAAPVVGRVLSDGLAYLRVPPDDDPWKARQAREEERTAAARAKRRGRPSPAPRAGDAVAEPVAIGPGQVPDLAGKSLREASTALASLGCRVGAEGSGVVLRQSPAPGSPVTPGQVCSLVLGAPSPEPDESVVADLASSPPRSPSSRPKRGRR